LSSGTKDRAPARPAVSNGGIFAQVVAQDAEPRGDIIGMANRGHDAERSAEEGAADLGNQFFARIVFAAERARQIAPEARRVTGGMGLMPISA